MTTEKITPEKRASKLRSMTDHRDAIDRREAQIAGLKRELAKTETENDALRDALREARNSVVLMREVDLALLAQIDALLFGEKQP